VPQITHLTCLVDNAGDDTTEIISFLDKDRKLKQLSSGMWHHVSRVHYNQYTHTQQVYLKY